MKYIRLAFTLSFLFLQLQLSAFNLQDSIPLSNILEKKSKLNHAYPIEKVHLHFDKPYYAVGDTMWFKAYVSMDLHIPSPLSKVLYVELINDRDSLIETLKLPINNSNSNGSFVLTTQNVKAGNYHVRSYTKWMLNYDASYFFKKNIVIGNVLNKEVYTHISFNGSANDKTSKITAQIEFKDEKNQPLKNRKVSWEVIADFEKAAKGKGTTDDKGILTVSFSVSQKVAINTGQLNTSIEVGNNRSINSSFPLKTAILESDIQFFPEGGELIAGLPTFVAFKAIRTNGLGIDVSGEIVDADGKSITTLKSQHLGMGKFIFTPEVGKSYKANINFADGSKGSFSLPDVKTKGMSITVKDLNEENLQIQISANEQYLKEYANKGFYILGQSSNTIYYAAQSTLRNAVYSAQIPKNKFPTGIVQFTLLSSTGDPISERLVFVKQADSLHIEIKASSPTYNSRQKALITLNAYSLLEKVSGNYSVSVVDETKVPVNEDSETTILSNLLLSSDLEGYIEKPNYYFNNVNTKKLENLDILLMTQGYRRFIYKDIIADKFPNITYYPEQGIDISGTVRKSSGMPLENGRLLLQIPDKHYSVAGNTDKEGNFIFNNLVFQDSSEVIVNARNNLNSKDLRIMVNGEAYPAIFKNTNAAEDIINIDSVLYPYLENSKIQNSTAFQLREIVVKSSAVKRPNHADHSALTGLSMMADHNMDGEQLKGCNNLLNCLGGGLGLTYIDQQLFLSQSYLSGVRIPIAIYVNGMEVDVNYLNSVSPSGIDNIEVFKNDALSGINRRTNTNGVLVINMKEIKKTKATAQQIKDLFPPTNVLTLTPKGYSAERQFYHPKYSGPRTSMQAVDTRSTIYWNPMVITDADGKASFEYFNGDQKGFYRIVVEGTDNNGQIGRKVFRYEVK
jgi:hypothetical protein